MKPLHVWVFCLALFVIVRWVVKGFSPDGWVMGVIFMAASLQWCIIPYIYKKDMTLFSYPNEVLKRGRDNALRLLIFLTGIFMLLCAMFAG